MHLTISNDLKITFIKEEIEYILTKYLISLRKVHYKLEFGRMTWL